MKKTKFIPVAKEEFLSEVTHYNTIKNGLGANFILAVKKTVALACEFPNAGVTFVAGTRRIVVKGFPISLVYKLLSDHIVIFAVVNQSRRDCDWCSRVDANLL